MARFATEVVAVRAAIEAGKRGATLDGVGGRRQAHHAAAVVASDKFGDIGGCRTAATSGERASQTVTGGLHFEVEEVRKTLGKQ